MTDVVDLNRRAWDLQSRNAKSPWVQPVSSKEIAAARPGEWSVKLAPNIAVPSVWPAKRSASARTPIGWWSRHRVQSPPR